MAEVARYAVDGQLRTVVHARLPLTEAAQAHRIIEERTHLGRLLLIP
jgi:NADPH:quinone reductase-like Zn-dependent oxidoreductase